MKYLGIHHLIWYVLVIVFTTFQVIVFSIANIIYFLWCFKRFSWKHFTMERNFPYHGVYDNTIMETLVRRFKYDLRI